jgi:hypothetical protein
MLQFETYKLTKRSQFELCWKNLAKLYKMKKHPSRRGKERTTREDQTPTKKHTLKHKHANKVVYIIEAPK